MSNYLNYLCRSPIFHQVSRAAVFLLALLLFSGCNQLPVRVGIDPGQDSSSVKAKDLTKKLVASEEKSEEEKEPKSPFDLDLDLDERKQSELDSALKRLVKDLEKAMLEADEGIDVNDDGTYLVRKGDYLDKIIKSTVGDYPFKRDILRKAFVSANPKVFRRSNPNWMYANKKMRIPGVDDIKKVIFKDQPKGKSSSEDPYAGWVRYP